ncbi:MAG: hypothetical protein HeimC2_20580 [Candidatus Heimdallarchaeota archaeon LC_2]|nr:MAG: hypothetical protein HeimC2_20580 [Candidatus Heimdallarchaeota archaeon LC_2]
MIAVSKSQVYCEECGRSYWLEFADESTSNGIFQKSLIHNDYVLIVDIDHNGVVRKSKSISIEHDPMASLIDDVAQAFHYVNGEPGEPIVIDCYTSNSQFVKFIQSIIMKMFEQATTNHVEDKFSFSVSTFKQRTSLHSERLHLSVSPYIKNNSINIKDPTKGIILDIMEAEQNKLDIEKTLEDYSWAAVIVPKSKKEGYFHALSSYFKEKETPFFIESLSNNSLKELFDFIFAITLEN